jgi:hypothetical protein
MAGQRAYNCVSIPDLVSPTDGLTPTGHGVPVDTLTVLEACIPNRAKLNAAIALASLSVRLAERLYGQAQKQRICKRNSQATAPNVATRFSGSNAKQEPTTLFWKRMLCNILSGNMLVPMVPTHDHLSVGIHPAQFQCPELQMCMHMLLAPWTHKVRFAINFYFNTLL